MNIVIVRITLMSASIVCSIFFGMLPLKIYGIVRKMAEKSKGLALKRLSLSLCLVSCFSAGVLLSTCILNMIPEIQLHYNNILLHKFWNWHYPMPELLMCIGFFLVYFTEELFLLIWKRKTQKKKSTVTFLEIETVKLPMIKDDKDDCKDIINDKSPVQKQPKSILNNGDTFEAPFKRHAQSHLIRSATMFYSLALHSCLEGLSYGLRKDKRVIINIFLVTITHQCVLAFAFGVQLWRVHWFHKKFVVASIVALSLATPLGAISGLALSQSSRYEALKETLLLIFESFASGALLYVIFFEILENERNNEHSDFLKLFSMIPGFLVVSAITLAHLKETIAGNEVHDLHG